MRPADAHLNPQEFELLLFGAVDPNAGEGLAPEAQQHLGECAVCQATAEKYHRAEGALKSLLDHYKSHPQENMSPGSKSDCPADDTWSKLAAGLIKRNEIQHYVAHASTCGRCGPLLKDWIEVMSEEVTSEEQDFLTNMVTPEWQRETARKLAEINVKKNPAETSTEKKPAAKKSFWSFTRPPYIGWAGAGLALVVVAATSWFVWLKTKGPNTDQLVTQAYTEQRTLELRLQGAHYGPLRVERGAKGLRPLVLVEAEVMIRRKLEKQPQDPRLLQLLGRTKLLEWNYPLAIDSFKRALELDPDLSAIRIDLAAAYFERAEESGNVEDYHNAIELLGQVLQKNPDELIALFNRAILEEKTFAYHQAVEDWDHYLRLRPNDEWSQEARERLDELKKKITTHDRKAFAPLLDAAAFSRELTKEQTTGVRSIDFRVEQYQQKALEEWVVPAFERNATDSRTQKEARSAVEDLAHQMAVEHGDDWFNDMLHQRVTTDFHMGMEFLREAVLLSGRNQADRAETAAQKAIDRFVAGRNFPGIARARLEKIYTFQIQLKYHECLDDSRDLMEILAPRHYGWIKSQIQLEQAICSNGSEDFNLSENSARAALELARRHHFPTLEQRILGTDAFNLYGRGLEQQGLAETTEGLRQYWQAASPPARGFQFYWNLFSAAESKAQWHLAVVFGAEAVHEIALTEFKKSEASSRSQLALVAARAGEASLARAEAAHAEEMIAGQLKDPTDPYVMELKIARAEVELKTGNAAGAMDLLKQVRPGLDRMTHYAMRLRYYATLGSSALQRNLPDESDTAFNEAVRIGDDAAQTLNSDTDRLAWKQATSFSYRSAVELRMARGDYSGALDLWERYKFIAIGEDPGRALHLSGHFPANSAGIVWALLPHGLATWMQTPEGAYAAWTAMDEETLRAQAGEFTELCTNPASNPAAISDKGRRLYKTLLGPISSHLHEDDLIVVEADGPLARIPFPVLESERGTPLVDNHPILYTLSLRHYLESSGAILKTVVRQKSKAIIVASRTSGETNDAAVVYNSDKEARMVASHFSEATLLEGHAGILTEIKRKLPQADVFDFVGHSAEMKGQTGLVLWSQEGKEAEMLKPSGSKGDRLHLKLAVLSACSTGRASEDGLLNTNGLVRTFLSSGTTAVVATGWSLDSEVAARFIDLFYTELAAGSDIPRAMRRTQMSLRRTKQFVHPYYWATFAPFA